MNPKQVVENIIRQDGYAYGKPWNGKETIAVIVPILKTKNVEKRDYVLVEEVPEKIEFKDSGSITDVYVKSEHDKPIFIRSGTILEGSSTQSRAVEGSKIIMPIIEEVDGKEVVKQSGIKLDVRCVHMTHGIKQGNRFVVAGSTPINVHKSLYKKSQRAVWDQVGMFSMNTIGERIQDDISYSLDPFDTPHRGHNLLARSSPSFSLGSSRGRASGRRSNVQVNNNVQMDNLIGTLKSDTYSKTLDKFIREMPALENQVGIVVIDAEGVLGVELFDHPDSWKSASATVIKKYGEVFTKPAKVPFKIDVADERIPEVVGEFLKKITAQITSGEDGTHEFKSTDLYGEYTILNKILIHIIALRKEEKDEIESSKTNLSSLTSLLSQTSIRSEQIGSHQIRSESLFGGSDISQQSPQYEMRMSSLNQQRSPTHTTPQFLPRNEFDRKIKTKKGNEKVMLSVPWDELHDLDVYSNKAHGGDRSQAVRRLVRDGLERKGYL